MVWKFWRWRRKKQSTAPPPEILLPKGILHNWNISLTNPSNFPDIVNDLINHLDIVFAEIVECNHISYEHTLAPILETDGYFTNTLPLLMFPEKVTKDKLLEDMIHETQDLLCFILQDFSLRGDIHDRLYEFNEKILMEGDVGLSLDRRRALDLILRGGKRSGLLLDDDDVDLLNDLKKRMGQIVKEYIENVDMDRSAHYFFREELKGVSPDVIKRMDVDIFYGKYRVSLEPQMVNAVLQNCDVPSTRQSMDRLISSKCNNLNTELFEELIDIRDKEAKLLGYPNHAVMNQELTMARHPRAVEYFMIDMVQKLRPVWEADKRLYLELKREKCKELDIPFDEVLHPWDVAYYGKLFQRGQCPIQLRDYAPYFPLDHVLNQILQLLQDIFQLQFSPVDNPPLWDPQLPMYRVTDTTNDNLLGYFILDLYERVGKGDFFGNVQLQTGYTMHNGYRVHHLNVILGNFRKSTANKPTLLYHAEVEKLIVEFGRMLQFTCCESELAMFSNGDGIQRDFVNVPSQVISKWAWHPKTLSLLSKHYKTGDSLPPSMIQDLQKMQKCNQSIRVLGQIQLAMFDQRVHRTAGTETIKLYQKLSREITGLQLQSDANIAGNFINIVGGFSAGYYSSLWQEVLSADLFENGFGGAKVLNKEQGLKFRNTILKWGGSRDAFTLCKDFLGREPKSEAFLISKGAPTKVPSKTIQNHKK